MALCTSASNKNAEPAAVSKGGRGRRGKKQEEKENEEEEEQEQQADDQDGDVEMEKEPKPSKSRRGRPKKGIRNTQKQKEEIEKDEEKEQEQQQEQEPAPVSATRRGRHPKRARSPSSSPTHEVAESNSSPAQSQFIASRPSMVAGGAISARKRWSRVPVELFGGTITLQPPEDDATVKNTSRKSLVPPAFAMDTDEGSVAESTPSSAQNQKRRSQRRSGVSSSPSSSSLRIQSAISRRSFLSPSSTIHLTPTTVAAAASVAASLLDPLPEGRTKPGDVQSRLSFSQFPKANVEELMEKNKEIQTIVPVLVEQAVTAAAASSAAQQPAKSSSSSQLPLSSPIHPQPLPHSLFQTDAYHSGSGGFTIGTIQSSKSTAGNKSKLAHKFASSSSKSSSSSSRIPIASPTSTSSSKQSTSLFSRNARQQRQGTSSSSIPAPSPSPSSSFRIPAPSPSPSPSQQPRKPHAFNLQESLGRPIGWKLKTGKFQVGDMKIATNAASSSSSSSATTAAARPNIESNTSSLSNLNTTHRRAQQDRSVANRHSRFDQAQARTQVQANQGMKKTSTNASTRR